MKMWTVTKPIDKLEAILGLESPNHFFILDENRNTVFTAKEAYFPGFISRLKRGAFSTVSMSDSKDYEIDLYDRDGKLKARMMFDPGNGSLVRPMKWISEESKEVIVFGQGEDVPGTDLKVKSHLNLLSSEYQRNGKSVCSVTRRLSQPSELLLETSRYEIQFIEDLDPRTVELLISSVIFHDIVGAEASETPKSILGFAKPRQRSGLRKKLVPG